MFIAVRAVTFAKTLNGVFGVSFMTFRKAASFSMYTVFVGTLIRRLPSIQFGIGRRGPSQESVEADRSPAVFGTTTHGE